jgi:hypothetical protein
MLGGAQCNFHLKCVRTRYVELVFLHPVGSAGHVLHCGASEKRNVEALFLGSPGTVMGFIKRPPGHVTPNLCFASSGIFGHVLHFGVSGSRNVNTLFFMLESAQCNFHKKCAGTRYVIFVFLHPMGSVGHVVYSGLSKA